MAVRESRRCSTRACTSRHRSACVLGDQVYLSQSPDRRRTPRTRRQDIVKKEVLLTASAHQPRPRLALGRVRPDGRLYFNAGNDGMDVTTSPEADGRGGDHARAHLLRRGSAAHERGRHGADRARAELQESVRDAIDSFGHSGRPKRRRRECEDAVNYVMEGGNSAIVVHILRSWQSENSTHWHEENAGVAPGLLRRAQDRRPASPLRGHAAAAAVSEQVRKPRIPSARCGHTSE